MNNDELDPFAPAPDWMFETSVEARNALQQSGKVHPYTCGDDDCRAKTNGAPLTAVEGGWMCDHCGYSQRLASEAAGLRTVGSASDGARGASDSEPDASTLSDWLIRDQKLLREAREYLSAALRERDEARAELDGLIKGIGEYFDHAVKTYEKTRQKRG